MNMDRMGSSMLEGAPEGPNSRLKHLWTAAAISRNLILHILGEDDNTQWPPNVPKNREAVSSANDNCYIQICQTRFSTRCKHNWNCLELQWTTLHPTFRAGKNEALKIISRSFCNRWENYWNSELDQALQKKYLIAHIAAGRCRRQCHKCLCQHFLKLLIKMGALDNLMSLYQVLIVRHWHYSEIKINYQQIK